MYLLGCKDVDVFSIAGGSELSDVLIVDRRKIDSKIEVDCSHHRRVCGVDNVVLGGREGGRGGKERGREVCTSLSLPFHCGCKNCFSFVKGICYRILCSESTFAFMSLNWNPKCLHN